MFGPLFATAHSGGHRYWLVRLQSKFLFVYTLLTIIRYTIGCQSPWLRLGMTVPHKICTACGIEKPVSEFHRDNRAAGMRAARSGLGVTSRCKTCSAERRKPGINEARRVAAALAAQGLKRCSVCEQAKELANFNVRRASADGLCYKCRDCSKNALEEWRRKNPGAFRRWSEGKKDRLSERFREWREANLEHLSRAYAAWAKANPDRVRALVAKRKVAKRSALVPWADHDAIRAIYAEAARLTRETGIRHEVDHIYPLQGETVCGLHVENNLQILTKTENIRKKNRMPEEYEEMRRQRLAA